MFTKLLEANDAGKQTFPFTSGKNKYDFLEVDKLADLISAAVLQSKIVGIINCCSGNPISLGEAVEGFIKKNQLKIKLDYGAFPDRPYDSPAVWGDASRIEEILKEN